MTDDLDALIREAHAASPEPGSIGARLLDALLEATRFAPDPVTSSGRVYPPPVLALYAASTAAEVRGGPYHATTTERLERCQHLHEELQALGWDITQRGIGATPLAPGPIWWIPGERGPELYVVPEGATVQPGGQARPCICEPAGDGTDGPGWAADPECPHHGRAAIPATWRTLDQQGAALWCPRCGNHRGVEGDPKAITCTRCGTLTPPTTTRPEPG